MSNSESEDQVDLTSQDAKTRPRRSRQFCRLLVFLTAIGVVAIGLLHFGREWLNESFGLDPGIANVLRYLIVALLLIAWNLWILFFYQRKLIGLTLLGALPILGVVLFQPVFDGDLGIDRWESRFGSSERNYAQVVDRNADELSNEISVESTEFDFPQFLGANRDGVVSSVTLVDSWDLVSPETVWTIQVGEGWTGFAIVGDYAFTQEQREELECVTCYEIESGRQVWNYSVQRRHEDISAMGRVGPRATPTVFEGRVFALSGTGVLDCLDAVTGDLLWTIDIPSLVGIEQIKKVNSRGLEYTQETSSLTWGRSASPLIYQDVVIVPAGGPVDGDAVTMIAFDQESGEERWRGGKRTLSYGSPSLIDIGGETQICLITENAAVGHDPETGIELWSHDWPGHSDGDASCSQITPIDHQTVLLSKGYGVGGQVISVKKVDDAWTTETIKSSPRVLKTKMTNPVIFQGNAYSLSDGFLECTEVPTLRRLWKKRGRFGNGQLLLVGDKLLIHSEEGTLYLVAASPDRYQQLGKHKTIRGVCWNTIALSRDRLIVRSELEAAMIRVPIEN